MQTRAILRSIIGVAVSMVLALPVFGAQTKGVVSVSNATLSRNGELMTATMDLSLADLKVKSAGAAVIQPMIVNGKDTLRLPTVDIYGRTSWYTAERNNRMPLGVNPVRTMRYSRNMGTIQYNESVDYQPWMNGSELVVEQIAYGCAGCNQGEVEMAELARYKNVVYEPTLIYEAVVADAVKTRQLSGRAFIDFPVNRIEIYPDYRSNTIELAKIIGTIDSVRNDRDITVTSISIKGFASPEGPYNNNIRLAKGRTEALKNYVQSLYRFAPGFIKTSYEPEDWEGLREYVVNSAIENRAGILSIIDSNMAPDPKNTMLQQTYPVQYQYLYTNVYPALRHSDYTIEYTIRTFSDPVEIREILRTAPQKLSLGEIYLAVQGLEPGSEEYNEIFETAVRMYPNEPAASLNAANAALQRRDTVSAERYLRKAGDSPQAIYARGVLAAMNGDFKTGIALIEQAVGQGLKVDQSVLDHIREAAKYAD